MSSQQKYPGVLLTLRLHLGWEQHAPWTERAHPPHPHVQFFKDPERLPDLGEVLLAGLADCPTPFGRCWTQVSAQVDSIDRGFCGVKGAWNDYSSKQ